MESLGAVVHLLPDSWTMSHTLRYSIFKPEKRVRSFSVKNLQNSRKFIIPDWFQRPFLLELFYSYPDSRDSTAGKDPSLAKPLTRRYFASGGVEHETIIDRSNWKKDIFGFDGVLDFLE